MEQKKIANVLTILFYVFAVISVVTWYFTPDRMVDRTWLYLGIGAIAARLVTYLMKYLF